METTQQSNGAPEPMTWEEVASEIQANREYATMIVGPISGDYGAGSTPSKGVMTLVEGAGLCLEQSATAIAHRLTKEGRGDSMMLAWAADEMESLLTASALLAEVVAHSREGHGLLSFLRLSAAVGELQKPMEPLPTEEESKAA